MRLPLWRVAEFTGASGDLDPESIATGYSTDSRTLQPGEVFFAITGETHDAHQFVAAALAKGAAAAVVNAARLSEFSSTKGLLAVNDPLQALQALGAAVRRLWGKTLIAVTGSAGKTTTKDAIAHVLGSRFRVLKTEGNLNNHIGLPLTLLKLDPAHEFAVVEVGMNHAGEIAALAGLAQPNVGVVTCVAPVHLEFFGSVAEIARAKYELVEGLAAGSTVVLNADDEYVSQFGRDFHGKVMTYGMRHPADVRAENVRTLGAAGSEFDMLALSDREPVKLPLLGEHNVMNALAAAAVALDRGMKPSEVAAALAGLQPADKRGQVLELAGATILNDCYNSNPQALKTMVDALVAMPATRRIVVAGEMLELGPAGEQLHRQCGRHIAERGVTRLIGVRGLARHMVEAAREHGIEAEFVETPELAGERIAAELQPGDAILLKASRGVRLEKALEVVQSRLGKSRDGE